MTATALRRAYPRTISLDGSAVTLRLMTDADAGAVLAFAQGLPEEDLLFLRIDITNPEVVARWVTSIREQRTITVLAEQNGELLGYGSLHYNNVEWQRHLGEIRLHVARARRARGLGRALAAEVTAIAQELGLQKLIAQMVANQRGARAMFERLGFQPEALLPDFVIDRAGRTRDLLITAHDLTGLTQG